MELKKDDLEKINLEFKFTINGHSDTIFQIAKFPSGKLVSVSKDKTIKIWNEDFTINETIINAHEESIFNISIKDNDNFATCSYDESIKFWKKKENKFECVEIIKEAHYSQIFKIQFYKENILLSCSDDKNVKIWEETELNKHIIKTKLIHLNVIYSFLILDDIHILITSGFGGTFFWNLNNFSLLFQINDVKCNWWNAIERLNKDNIIIGGKNNNNNILSIISISQKKIIQEFNNEFSLYSIFNFENKGIFLVGGYNDNFKIFRNDNFQFIKKIQTNDKCVYGFNILKDQIISFSNGNFTIWTVE